MRDTGSPPEQPGPAAGSQQVMLWLLLWLTCVVAMAAFLRWRTIPVELIWIGLATALLAVAWQAHRRSVARDRAEIAAGAQSLVDSQRQFLQDASHQLRTPITIALGHAELLARELAGQRRRDIDVVVGELERLRALSERLLLIAASENPAFLVPEPARLDLIAADLVRRWQPVAPRRWGLGGLDPVIALVDVQRLGQALDALVENAVRHTSTGDQITIRVIGEDHRLPEGGCLARLVVQDSGDGIPAEQLPHIFDRFATVAGSRSRGTGLGLALAQAIARGHGGDIAVSSTLGGGSRFELMLPAQHAGLASQACAGQTSSPATAQDAELRPVSILRPNGTVSKHASNDY